MHMQWNFAMNGQTGKFTGDLPVDYGKLGLRTAICTLIVGGGVGFLTKSIPLAVIAALIVALIVFFTGKGSMRPVHNASQANDYMDKDVKLVRADDTFLRTEKRPLNPPQR